MTQEQKDQQLDSLKKSHDYYATAIQLLTTRIQYYHEEFQGVANTIQFLTHFRDTLRKEIELIEPPKKDKQSFEMDLTHVKPEVTTELNS